MNELSRLYSERDDAGFQEYLAGWFRDLQYVPLPGAQPYSFGTGNLWRVAINHPGCPMPLCVPRAIASAGHGPQVAAH